MSDVLRKLVKGYIEKKYTKEQTLEVIYEQYDFDDEEIEKVYDEEKNQLPVRANTQRRGSHNNSSKFQDSALYRFVELNDKVVPAEPEAQFALDELRGDMLDADLDIDWIVETPILVGQNNENNASVNLKLNNKWVILGPSLRGMVRSAVEIISFGKLTRTDSSLTFMQKFMPTSPKAFASVVEENHPSHSGKSIKLTSDGKVKSLDIVDALFGYVYELEDIDLKDVEHKHLIETQARKSKISFSSAVADLGDFKQSDEVAATMMSPQPTIASGYFKGGKPALQNNSTVLAGRKRFLPRYSPPALGESSSDENDAIFKRLKNTLGGGGKGRKVVSHMKFLRPAKEEATFRSKIRLRGVTQVELGAVLWALSFGGQDKYRHMLGRAKGFGAGQVKAEISNSDIRRLDGRKEIAKASLSEPDNVSKALMKEFEQYMQKHITGHTKWHDHPVVKAYLDMCDPVYGKKVIIDK